MPYRVLPYIKGTDMNDEILKIYRGTAYAKIVASTYHPYAPTIRQFTQQFLTEYEFDTRFKRNRPTCHHLRFVHSESSLYIPVTFIPLLLEFLYKYNIPTEVVPLQPVVGRDIDVKMNPSWHDQPKQVAAIDYLINSKAARCGLALQTGCLVGETIIRFNRAKKGFSMPLAMAYTQFNRLGCGSGRYWDKNTTTFVRSFNGTNIQLHAIEAIVYSGKKDVWELTLANGQTLQGTTNHEIMTDHGFVAFQNIVMCNVMCDSLMPMKVLQEYKQVKDHYLAVPKFHPYGKPYQDRKWDCHRILRHRLVYEAYINKMTLPEYRDALLDPNKVATLHFIDPEIYDIHHIDYDHYNDDPSNLQCMLKKEHRALHHIDAQKHFNQGIPTYSRCVSLKYVGIKDTFDIICKDPYRNFVANDIVVHNSGKSYVANRAWVSLGKATMIVVAGFVDQWTKVILEQTNVGNKMYVVQGFESLGNLLLSNFKPDVIVWSLATLRAYVYNNENYQDLPVNYEQFLVKYGIGTKIFDEVHLNFHALTQVDLCSNVANNIYLTATFTSANKSTKRIFDKIYPVEMRFGAHDQDRYVAAYFYLWNSDVSEKKCVVMRGYNHTRYEAQLMKKETRFVDFMERVIIPLIRQHYLSIKRPGQKLLIFFATIVMIEKVLDYLTNHLEGDLVINKFVMGVHNRVLDESDIIVSTHKSCGTARDIKQLRTVINTISCKAETIVSQALGRLRKLKDEAAGDIPVYVDICDGNQSSHMRHYKDRSDIYKHKCLTYDEYRIF